MFNDHEIARIAVGCCMLSQRVSWCLTKHQVNSKWLIKMKTESWVHWKINEYEPNEGHRSYDTFEHNRRLRYIQCGLRSLGGDWTEVHIEKLMKSMFMQSICGGNEMKPIGGSWWYNFAKTED
ncbi:MAG: hypothetical protein ACTS6H_00865 [Candidatus Hodgkinia cicadicola]